MRRPLVYALLAGATAFVFRFLAHTSFANDHYVHLSRSLAMLIGDLPLRDYTEEGVPLTVAISAGAQALLGDGPFGELMWALTSLALGAGLICWAGARLTGVPALGLFAALVQVAAMPRLYSHPKVLIYPALFLIAWAYLRRPTTRRLAGLAAWTAFAFLMRHDHGVYSGVGGASAVALAHWPEGGRRLLQRGAAYAALVILCLAPYFAYAQYHVGIVEYFRTGIAISRSEAQKARAGWPRLAPIRAGGPIALTPRPPGSLPRISIRWRPGLTDAARRAHEQALGLLHAEPTGDARSWHYRVEPPATDALAALARLPEVEDVGGFDRTSLTLEDRPRGLHALWIALGLDRLTIGAPLHDLTAQPNAIVLLFYTLWLLPGAALLVWLVRRDSCRPPLHCGPEVPLLAIIAMTTAIGLVREGADHRVADGMASGAILMAWLGAALFTANPARAGVRRTCRLAAVLGGVLAVVLTARMALLAGHVERTAVWRGPAAMTSRARNVLEQSRVWPWPAEWPSPGGIELVPYLNRCTGPGDRLLVTFNAPEFNVFSRRAFAGGETLLMPAYRPPELYEGRVLDRLRQQRVPIVLADREQWPTFASTYPALADDLERRYQEAGEMTVAGDQRIVVLVDRQWTPTGVDAERGWPCGN